MIEICINQLYSHNLIDMLVYCLGATRMWSLNGVSLEWMGILGDEQAWAIGRGSERIQLRQNKGAGSSLNAQQEAGLGKDTRQA